MKKLLVFSLALIMTFAFTSISMGSTLGVNVDEGKSISIEKPSDSWDSVYITGNFGISDNLRLSVGYITEDQNDYDGFLLGARYELIENVAVDFKYESYSSPSKDEYDWTITLRGKMELSDRLDLAGLFGYTNADYYQEYFIILGQVEYGFNDFVTGNLGFEYDFNDDDNATYILTGLEFYPTENFTLWLDYSVYTDDSDRDWFGIGVEFAF